MERQCVVGHNGDNVFGGISWRQCVGGYLMMEIMCLGVSHGRIQTLYN